MIHLITSIAGAPGVSTAALGMTLAWQGPSMLVDTDFHQQALAGVFAGEEAPEPNLATLAITAARRGSEVGESIWRTARRLPGDAEPNRRLLIPGPSQPWQRTSIERQWGSLAPALTRLGGATGLDVVVDLGRLVPPTTSTPLLVTPGLLNAAAVVCVVIEPTLQGIAASRVMLQGLAAQAQAAVTTPPVGLVLREPATAPKSWRRKPASVVSYSPREITKELGLPVLGQLVHDPAGAIRLNQGKDWSRDRLHKNLTDLARAIKNRAEDHVASTTAGDLS